jgi:transposase
MRKRSRKGTDVPAAGSRMEPEPELTHEQWQLIAAFFPHDPPSSKGGRPRVEPRACVEGIVWVLRSGARWKDLPKRFPSPATCWRRLNEWTEAGIWEMAWARLVRALDRAGKIDHKESIADGTFSSAKKGVNTLARRSEVREPRSWSLPMERGFLLLRTSRARALTK